MKIKRSVGILSKLRYYVNTDILCNLYFALIYPLLIYGIVSWGNTYQTTLQPIIVLLENTCMQKPSPSDTTIFPNMKYLKQLSW